jgi:catechol 2,3-dioxygenase-like lactoylglutathione lyase family enzyme
MNIEFDHIALHVYDVQKSVWFYHSILGLPLLNRPAFDFNGAWIGIGGKRQLHLIEQTVDKVILSGSRLMHFAFTVENIREIEEICIKERIEFLPPKVRPDGKRQIFVKDPNGWYIEFNSDE